MEKIEFNELIEKYDKIIEEYTDEKIEKMKKENKVIDVDIERMGKEQLNLDVRIAELDNDIQEIEKIKDSSSAWEYMESRDSIVKDKKQKIEDVKELKAKKDYQIQKLKDKKVENEKKLAVADKDNLYKELKNEAKEKMEKANKEIDKEILKLEEKKEKFGIIIGDENNRKKQLTKLEQGIIKNIDEQIEVLNDVKKENIKTYKTFKYELKKSILERKSMGKQKDNKKETPPKQEQPAQTGPAQTGPAQTGPVQTGPVQTGPVQTGPVQTGPVQTGPAQTGPAQTGPAQTGPAKTGPAQTGPAQTGPAQTGPAKTGPTQTGPAQTGPAQTGPAQTGPAQTGPAQTGPAQTGPAQTGPTQTEKSQNTDEYIDINSMARKQASNQIYSIDIIEATGEIYCLDKNGKEIKVDMHNFLNQLQQSNPEEVSSIIDKYKSIDEELRGKYDTKDIENIDRRLVMILLAKSSTSIAMQYCKSILEKDKSMPFQLNYNLENIYDNENLDLNAIKTSNNWAKIAKKQNKQMVNVDKDPLYIRAIGNIKKRYKEGRLLLPSPNSEVRAKQKETIKTKIEEMKEKLQQRSERRQQRRSERKQKRSKQHVDIDKNASQFDDRVEFGYDGHKDNAGVKPKSEKEAKSYQKSVDNDSKEQEVLSNADKARNKTDEMEEILAESRARRGEKEFKVSEEDINEILKEHKEGNFRDDLKVENGDNHIEENASNTVAQAATQAKTNEKATEGPTHNNE